MKTLMRNGRDRRSENPFWATAKKERVVLFGTDQRITSGPAAKRLHSKAGYMAAPERFAESQIPLAPRAPSIHGPRRRCRSPSVAAGFWGAPVAGWTRPHRRSPPSLRLRPHRSKFRRGGHEA